MSGLNEESNLRTKARYKLIAAVGYGVLKKQEISVRPTCSDEDELTSKM